MKGGLPVIINIMDNQYGMGGQTRGETMGFDFAARIGAGVNPEPRCTPSASTATIRWP